MRDLVILPTCGRRPEFLWLCAEYIAACDSVNKEFWICEDVHKPSEDFDRTLEYSIKLLNARLIRRSVRNSSHDNIWRGLEEAYETDARLIYFIEDDIFITSDMFDWSEKVHEQFSPFVVCADNPWGLCESDDLSAMGISHSLFEPRAASIRREFLSTVLRPDHQYSGHPETVIQNYIIRTKQTMIWPLRYRAVDCGWYGENKSGFLSGTLENKIELVRKSLTDPAISRGFIKQPFKDVSKTSSDLYIKLDHRSEWEEQYKSQARWGF